MKKTRLIATLIGGISSLFIAGCSTVNLGDVPSNRENYNRALDSSENEQFLLNIVRLHYGENPYFVGVDSITAATSLTTGANGDFGVNNVWAPINGVQWSISPQISFSQTPTITYSPVQGGKFAKGMLAALSLDKIYLLLQSGYSPKEVMKLTFNRIGSLRNGSSSVNSSTATVPNTSAFDNFINTLDLLGNSNQIHSELTSYESKPAIFVYAANQDAAKTLAQSLHLSKPYTKLIFAPTIMVDGKQPENVISVHTRSFFNVLEFVSKDVDTPKATESTTAEYNRPLADPNVDWSSYTYKMLHVRENSSDPDNVITKTQYEGNWYYIAEDDELSKSTLVLLKLIYSLQMGEVQANLPLITIPVQ